MEKVAAFINPKDKLTPKIGLLEYFMNRPALLEVMARDEFTQYTGLPESTVRPANI
ncbi:hypothetical protein [Providencia hangzhouensis]|uniref:hypothetical protein n=1 Tax=Providencia hangzhouensis TaxID=3031799 RepID=UPI0034DD98E1